MCLFTHFAAGALAGAATGNVGLGIVAGLASHAVLDMIPHWDHPDWRVELGAGLASLLVLLMLPSASGAAVAGGLAGMAPDLENLFQKLGWMGRGRFVFPTHTGLLPHGRSLGPRSVVWQFAIWIGCFAALGLVAPGQAQAAGPAPRLGHPEVQVLQASDARTVVRLTLPVAGEPADWSQVDVRSLAWPVAGWTGEAGREDVPPQWPIALAVPTRAVPEVTVAAVDWWKQPDAGASLDGLVTVDAPAVTRGVPVGGAVVQLAPAGGLLRSIILDIRHPADARGRACLERASVEGASLRRARDATGVLNPDLMRRLADGDLALARDAAARTRDKADASALFGATSHWVRLELATTGLFHVTGQDLEGWGVPAGDVDPAKLRLYRGGGLPLMADPETPDSLQADRVGLNEVAIEVVGAGDGEWNLTDELRFYGVATSAWLDRLGESDGDRLHHVDHPYAAAAVYWLTWENDSTPSPLPGAPLRVAATAAPSQGGTTQAWAWVRQHNEQQVLENLGLVEDNFTWANTITSSRSETFSLRNPQLGTGVRYSVEVRAAAWTAAYQAEAWLNGDEANRTAISFSSTTQEDSLRVRIRGVGTSYGAGSNTMRLRNALTGSGQLLALDSFDIMAPSILDLRDGQGQLACGLWGDDVVAPDVLDLRVSTATPATTLTWDVTTPAAPVALAGTPGTQDVTFSVARTPGVDIHLALAAPGDLAQVTTGRRVQPVDLKARTTALDYIVVAPAGFINAAGDLAAFRSADLPGVAAPAAAAVLVDDIYDNFSGGQKDPLAIRNYLRWVWEQGGHRLAYACLLGNASRDPRNYKGKTAYADLYDLVPTVVRTVFPSNPVYPGALGYATDDGLVSFDTPPPPLFGTEDVDVPDLACGRLPALTPAEARSMVDRSIAYARNPEPGPWRNHVVMAADDANRPGFRLPIKGIEPRHTLQAEDLCGSYIPASVDVQKIYAVDYPFPPGSGMKPAVRSAINSALSAGTTMFYYVGHGAEDNLADEQIFRSFDIASLANGMKRFVFLAFSCDVGVFDSLVLRSMAEQFVAAEAGGAIAAICASQVSFVTSNELFSDAFYGMLFPSRQSVADQSLGRSLEQAKGVMNSLATRTNSQRYNLFGDPATVLPHPLGGLPFAAASLDTLSTGRRHTAVIGAGDVGAGDAYDLMVSDSMQDAVFTCYDYYTDPSSGDLVFHNPTDYPWVRPGATVFRGNGTAGGAGLSVPFKAPLQLDYGDRGRVRMVVQDGDRGRAAVQAVPVVSGGTGVTDDLRGPEITLGFEDGRYRVQPGTQLEASLADTSGIAMLGTSPGNSILLEFDDTGFMTNVTGGFAYDPDSYTAGRLAFGLPSDLEAGRHTVALYAADALGNVGSDTLGFELVPAGLADIASVTLFPNPTSGPCRLIFELSEPMTVRWDIYTVGGRLVRSIQQPFPSAGPRIIEWDGRDTEGDAIANGTYLFVLRGVDAGRDGRDITRTGKLVVMR